ncbi:MAG: ATPase, T2SS/T4P/T4SS family [Phycisphaerae bacterium]|nr:ATPase, T2SS/T4P/T4SS family [Phycisphaerae bacterium]
MMDLSSDPIQPALLALAVHPGALLAQATVFTLVSFIKPVLMLATLIPFMWVAAKIEADTRRFLLPTVAWNGILMAVAALGIAAALLIPIFWIGWPVMILILIGGLWGYWQWRDQRVPANNKFKLISTDFQKQMAERQAKKNLAESTLKFMTASGKGHPMPLKDSPEYAVHMALEGFLAPALERRVSRLDLVATAPQQPLVPLNTIDGVRIKGEPLAPQTANEAIDYLKKIAGLQLDERRRRQTAEIRVAGPTRDAAARVSVWGSNAGQSLRVDFDRAKQLQVSFDSLGLLPAQMEALTPLAEPARRHGVVLLSSLPGQGITTTSYSFMARHDAYTCNIKTLEKVVELNLEGVDHSQFNPANPTVDYATNLQSILRRDPDVVYVSDISDANVGRIASTPGLNGPLIYITVPAESIGAAVTEWFRTIGDLKQASKGLVGVVHQRLIRKVCEACRQPLQLTPDLLKKLGAPQGKNVTAFRQNGKVQVKNRVEDCPVCQGTGYFGLTACFEVMMVDDAMRSMLAEGDFKSTYAYARREGKMMTLQEAAMAKVREGVTTVDELVRVFPAPKTGPAPVKA